MEKRSHRRIRDLVALTAFQGLDANEIGCARISIMAGEQDAPFKGPNTDERDQSSPNRSHPACNTRPVHTDVPKGDVTASKGSDYFCSFEKDVKYRDAQLDTGDAQSAFRGDRSRQ